jgi:hypothetical protein
MVGRSTQHLAFFVAWTAFCTFLATRLLNEALARREPARNDAPRATGPWTRALPQVAGVVLLRGGSGGARHVARGAARPARAGT